MLDLEPIKKREQAASPGPWHQCSANGGKCQCHLIWDRKVDCVVIQSISKNHEDITEGEGVTQEQAHANGEFVANARQDIPALIREIVWLRRQLEAAREEVEVLEKQVARGDT